MSPTRQIDDVPLDPATVTALYHAHAEELRLFLTGVLRDPEAAAEVMQVTFTKVVESGHTAREETRKGWLFRVAFHEAMLYRRNQATQARIGRNLAHHEPQPAGSSPESPDGGLLRQETVETVRQALTSLSPDQQLVVRMRIYEERTFATIAEQLNLPLGTVLTRMRAALEKLRKALGRHGDQSSS